MSDESTTTWQDPFTEPQGWDFFQAMRQIECAHPDCARLGTSETLADDPARFGQFVTMAFAGTELDQLPEQAAQERDERVRRLLVPYLKERFGGSGGDEQDAEIERCVQRTRKLLIHFTGLTGPNGALPLILTEFIRNPAAVLQSVNLRPEAEPARDPALAEFVDLFHHRLICLFYRAWASANKAVDFDRHDQRQEEGYFTTWIASTFGHGLPEHDGLDGIPTWEKLAFAGHLSGPTRHLDGLRGLLAAAFNVPCEVEPLTGHFITIPKGERCLLGETPATGSIGKTCVVGARFWDVGQRFTVRLGPLSFEHFRAFQPGGQCHRRLHDWIDFYTRREFSWEATIILRRKDAPGLQFRHPSTGDSAAGHAFPTGNQLGRDAWLFHCTPGQPPDAPHDLTDYHLHGGSLVPGENH